MPSPLGVGLFRFILEYLFVANISPTVKPVSKRSSVQGFTLLGVAPYAGALNNTWFDRDLGIGGRVIVKGANGKVSSKLVKLDWPSKIPNSICL